MTDCGPQAMLDRPLRFQLSRCLYTCMYVSCQHQRLNLCFSNENAMTDFRKTWYVLHEVRALGTYKYFQAFPVVLKKMSLTVSKCFHVSTYKSCAYYQLHRNKSKFLDYISESFLRKGIS